MPQRKASRSPEPQRKAEAAGAGGDYEARLAALYEQYDPANLHKVAALLEKNMGNEEAVIAVTKQKFEASAAEVSRLR